MNGVLLGVLPPYDNQLGRFCFMWKYICFSVILFRLYFSVYTFPFILFRLYFSVYTFPHVCETEQLFTLAPEPYPVNTFDAKTVPLLFDEIHGAFATK
jgi:hypothetical protein